MRNVRVMKTKVSRVKNKALEKKIPLEDRLKGVHCFLITGPCSVTGVKVSACFVGTRKQANEKTLISESEAKRQARIAAFKES